MLLSVIVTDLSKLCTCSTGLEVMEGSLNTKHFNAKQSPEFPFVGNDLCC